MIGKEGDSLGEKEIQGKLSEADIRSIKSGAQDRNVKKRTICEKIAEFNDPQASAHTISSWSTSSYCSSCFS
jgi:hypothetical protein